MLASHLFSIILVLSWTSLLHQASADYGCEQQCSTPHTDVFYHLQATIDSYVIIGSHVAFDQEDDVTYHTRTWRDNGSKSAFCDYNDGNTGILGPCLTAKPGQLVSIMVTNNMEDNFGPGDPTPEEYAQAIKTRYNSTYLVENGFLFYNTPVGNASEYVLNQENMPKHFSNTNLHLHGVQVGPHMYYPQGTSEPDSDWITITPSGAQKCFCYQFQLPDNHPSGLFLYHIHRHGSAAMQGWSGMFGFFMIDSSDAVDRQLQAKYGLQTVLPFLIWDPHMAILQGETSTRPGVPQYVKDIDASLNARPQTNTNEQSTTAKGSALSLTSTNNKQQQQQQQHQHDQQVTETGVSDFIKAQTDQPDALLFLTNNDYQPTFDNLETESLVLMRVTCVTIENLCSFKIVNAADPDTNLKFHVVASDGLTYSAPVEMDQLFLAGGMREDILVQFPDIGSYEAWMYNVSDVQFFGTGPSDQLLARFQVKQQGKAPPIPVKEISLVPAISKPITRSDITNRRSIMFSMNTDTTKLPFPQYVVNDKPFDHTHVDETVVFKDVEEWVIQNNDLTVHPFHIHMNSFLVAEVRSDYKPDSLFIQHVVNTTNPPNRYRDTVIVPPKGMVRIWIKFEHEYVGKTVYHCHFLAHEDSGMISNVLVEKPLDLKQDERKQQQP